MTAPETIQERLRTALIGEVAERGYEKTTVEGVITRAAITRAEFKTNYEDLEDCAIRVFERSWEEFTDDVVGGFEADAGPWRDRLRGAAYGAADWIEVRPELIDFMSEMFKAQLMAQAKSLKQLQRLIDMIDAGRSEPGAVEGLSRRSAEAVFGAIMETIVRNASQGERGRPASYVPSLMYIAVRPYLGHEAALEELDIAPPARAGV